MDQVPQNKTNPTIPTRKQYRAFWPVIIIIVLSAFVGGLIVWVAFNDSLTEDISSMDFVTHKRISTTTPLHIQTTKTHATSK